MSANSLPSSQSNQHFLNSDEKQLNLETAQEKIYSFLLRIVKTWEPKDVLQEFKRLFIDNLDSANSHFKLGIYKIFGDKNEHEFDNTIKRCCYILINNWEATTAGNG